ncbi:MAG: hypothetical protein JW958_07750 [Candidatus Eisenbacteria bacterium]|nr:hypothetical protein [Candidatus Eisenbacteria bacterium]
MKNDSCALSIDRIARMLGGFLPETERTELENHLRDCSRCRAELALQRAIGDALAEKPAAVLPADFTERVMGRLEHFPTRLRPRLRPVLLRGAAVAVLVAASLAPLLSGGRGGGVGLSGVVERVGSVFAVLAAPLEWSLRGIASLAEPAMEAAARMIPLGPIPLLALLLVGASGVWGLRAFHDYLRE